MPETAHLQTVSPERRFFKILGVRVAAVQIPEVIQQLEQWIAERNGCHYVTVTDMHGVTEAQHDPTFREILNTADLVVPDGMSLIWFGRWRGQSLRRRVYGPELMLTFCERTTGKGYRHFFYGGAPGIAEQLAEALIRRFPGLVLAGTYSPPFRSLTADEDEAVVSAIERTAPDVLWVGLGTPKQERWMYEYCGRLSVPVLIGVGAAFDIHAGKRKQAPRWMRDHGLEWLFRLFQEPRRLWRRYLVYGSEFIAYVALEMLGLRKID